jgi:hypothetical protein
MRGGMRLAVGLAAVTAAFAVAPVARAAPEPDLYDVTMLGTYTESRDTVAAAASGAGASRELVIVRWRARTAVAVPLQRVGRRGAGIAARLTGTVMQYRRSRSDLVDGGGGMICPRIEQAAIDATRRAPRLAFDLSGTLTASGAARLRTTLPPLPVVVRASQRCAAVVPEPDVAVAVPLRPLVLPPAAQLAPLLHVPAATVRRGRPFEVERAVVLEEPGADGSLRVRRWSLHLSFSPCPESGC